MPKPIKTMARERKNQPKLVVILGPTACGKTKLAVNLAKAFNGEIVSADSRQVYKKLDIGTGKDLQDYGSVPYHLIDIASPKTQFTLAKYQKLAYQAIDKIIGRGKMPFLVGGSGLYLQAVIDGYNLTEAQPDQKLRKRLNKKNLDQLQKLVKKERIELNQSDFNNKRRLIRALEIKSQNKQPLKSKPRYDCLILGLKYPREIINQRIDKRMNSWLKEGLIEEVKNLREKEGLSWNRLDEFGLEYRYTAKYLKDEIDYTTMIEEMKNKLHQFAKRQLTWFNRDRRIIWLKSLSQAKKLITNFL